MNESDIAQANEQRGWTKGQPESTDEVLAILVHIAATFKIEQPITLLVNGMIVTGQLIGARTYFEEMAAALDSATASEIALNVAHALADIFRAKCEEVPAPLGPDDEPEDTALPRYRYIHLRDCRYYSTDGTMLPSNGLLWRGKLSSVNAFSLGRLRRDDSD